MDVEMGKASDLYNYHLEHGNVAGLYLDYAALPEEQINEYIDIFLTSKDDIEERLDLLLYLALYSADCGPYLPDRLYRYLIDNEVFYYPEFYLRANPAFADELIGAIETVVDERAIALEVNHILCALAMMPSQRVNDFLLANSQDPLPIWARSLYITPACYAQVGGWEARPDGQPRRLHNAEVTAFERCPKADASPFVPVAALDEECGLCGQPLSLVFDGNMKLATCLYCSCYQTLFTRYDKAGVRWHEANAVGDFFTKHPSYQQNDQDIAAGLEYGLRPVEEPRTALWAAHQYPTISHSQIGGLPTPVNDVNYPTCPDCGQLMVFTAQLDMADIDDGEGLYYFFTCQTCGTVGANYDQT